MKSEIFAKIIDTIEFEYGNLIGENVNRMDIIKWCIKKEFWQQAMTLCTEWLPEEIVDRGICEPTNENVIKEAELIGLSFGRGWKQQLIISYQDKNENASTVKMVLDTFLKEFRLIISKIPNLTSKDKDSIKNFKCKKLTEFINEYERSIYDFSNFKYDKITVNCFKNKYPVLSQALQMIYDNMKKNPNFKTKFISFLTNMNYNKMITIISKMTKEDIMTLFELSEDEINQKTVSENKNESEPSDKKWQNREGQYRSMLRNGILKTNINEDTAVDLLHDYYDIRNQRNKLIMQIQNQALV